MKSLVGLPGFWTRNQTAMSEPINNGDRDKSKS